MISLEEYDFHLPESLIAKTPPETRTGSRLLVLDRKTQQIQEGPYFSSIKNWLRPGDTLVYNETKVSHRRVYLSFAGKRTHESIFLEEDPTDPLLWLCILKNRAKLKNGDILSPISFPEWKFEYRGEKGELSILASEKQVLDSDFLKFGTIPIPPYLRRKAEKEDIIRYQTIFAKNPGSVAAPTAGLHFSDELKLELEQYGVKFVPVELKIGYGTFQPLSEENFKTKRLHSETFVMSFESAKELNQTKKEGKRVIAIGTTALRVLESVYDSQLQKYLAKSGQTDIFLQPEDPIHSIQGLITNFHLPKSSLLLLVAAFGGKNFVMDSYRYALEKNFRFYSYGDSMFLF